MRQSIIEKNKQLILGLFNEVFNQQTTSVIDKFYAPNVVDHSAFPGQATGTKGIKNTVQDFLETFADLEVAVEDVIAENDKVVTRETWKGIHNPSGKSVEGSVIHIFRIRGDKITEEWSRGWSWLEEI